MDSAWDLVKDWDAETREALRIAASEDGLGAVVGNLNMLDLSKEALEISMAGLKARAIPGAQGMIPDETHFLNALQDSVESGMSPADELIRDFLTKWDGDLNQIFKDYSY